MKSNHLKVILEKMCSYTDVLLEDVDISKDGWYTERTWTSEQEHNFMVWLTRYLYENQDAQEKLYHINNASLKACQERASWFCMMYGWSTQQEKE